MTRRPSGAARRRPVAACLLACASLLAGAALPAPAVGGALAGPPASAPHASGAADDASGPPNELGFRAPERTGCGSTPDASAGLDGRALVVADAETGERLLVVPVAEGTTIALNYTHSVEKTPVLDVYEVNGSELEMVRMEFESYGAGLPADADVTVTGDDAFVFDPAGSYDRLHVAPGPVADHRLRVGDRTYDLVALSDGRTVTLSVECGSATTRSTPAVGTTTATATGTTTATATGTTTATATGTTTATATGTTTAT